MVFFRKHKMNRHTPMYDAKKQDSFCRGFKLIEVSLIIHIDMEHFLINKCQVMQKVHTKVSTVHI